MNWYESALRRAGIFCIVLSMLAPLSGVTIASSQESTPEIPAPAVLDSDSDGLTDIDEATIYLTNSLAFDTDGDGVGDGDELVLGTDPLTAPAPEPEPVVQEPIPAEPVQEPVPAEPVQEPVQEPVIVDDDLDGIPNDVEEAPVPVDPAEGEGDGATVDDGAPLVEDTSGKDGVTDEGDTDKDLSEGKPSVPEIAPAGGNHRIKVTICHANNGSKGYSLETVDDDSILRNQGHDSHDGDIIPSFEYKKDGRWTTYPGKNTDKLDYIGNGCKEPKTPALLPSITVEQAQCVDGTISKPVISIGDYSGVTITAPTGYSAGDTVYIYAELEQGYSWPSEMAGWISYGKDVVKYRITLDNAPKCYPTLPDISVDQAACVDGSLTDPLITVGTSVGVSTVIDPETYEAGDTVYVRATLLEGFRWPSELPAGWQRSGSKAVYKIKLDDVHCKPKISISKSADVETIAPGGTVTFTITVSNTGNGTASGVVVTDTLQSGFSGWSAANGCTISGPTISCDLGSIAPGGSASVTASATVAETAQCDMSLKNLAKVTWSRGSQSLQVMGQGGGHHGGEAWSNKVWIKVECEEAQLPEVALTNAVCTGGEVTDSSFTLTPGEGFQLVSVDPAGDQSGDTYSYDGNEDHEITITIALEPGYTMPDDLGEWVQDGNTLSLTFTLLGDPCIEAMLATPDVTGNVCEAGVYTPPTVTTGPSEGITYSGGEVDLETGEYTVTATLLDGYAWPETLPEGWVEVDATTATYSDTLDLNECEIIQPMSPEIAMSMCIAGEVTEPSLTIPADTDVIDYELREGDPVINDDGSYSYLVTATIVVDGYAFAEEGLLEGWTYVSPTVVEFSITLPLDECEIVEPVAPGVTQAVCTGGVLEAPEIILATEPEGISYEIDGSVVPGATVTVIATITEDGLAWPDTLPDGWAEVDALTATYTIVLDDVECEQVMLAAPDVTQAVCTDGVLVDPTIVPVEREGIEYSFDEADVVSGGTVVITATIVDDGLSWADPIGEGWVFVSDTEATYTVQLDSVQCVVLVPVIPEVTASECVGGVLTFPSITAPQTEGIVYSWDPDDVVFGGTVIVTATLLPGYTWPAGVDEAGLFDRSIEVAQLASVSPSGQMVGVAQAAPTWPEEWVIVNETTATYTLELVERTCEDVVLPNLAIANAVCLAGTPGDPTLSVSPTTGVAYSYDEGDVVNGGSVLVTATLTDGYKWGTLSNGWSVIDPATAALSVDFDDVECNRAAPSPNNPVVKGLPNTGAAENTSAASGLWMLAATGAFGAAIAGLGLRKRPER